MVQRAKKGQGGGGEAKDKRLRAQERDVGKGLSVESRKWRVKT